jgi:hypothetical protein
VLYGTFVTGMTKCQLLCPFFGRERKRRPRESSRHQFSIPTPGFVSHPFLLCHSITHLAVPFKPYCFVEIAKFFRRKERRTISIGSYRFS